MNWMVKDFRGLDLAFVNPAVDPIQEASQWLENQSQEANGPNNQNQNEFGPGGQDFNPEVDENEEPAQWLENQDQEVFHAKCAQNCSRIMTA